MKQLKLEEDILVQNIDNEAVIVSPSQGMITTVNETGSFLIKFIKDNENTNEESLINTLIQEYDTSKEDATKGVLAFLKEMENHKIII